MGCTSCGKGKRRTRQAPVYKKDGTKQTPQQEQRSLVKKKRETYTLIPETGRTQTFGSFLEANAARVRQGGGTIR